ncbi:MAG: helix-turn-helix transcriptional regulator [Pseudomonadota bacterium]|nr:helix-turn-helix transcriptional regulator [Pseudomonadota bacterium]
MNQTEFAERCGVVLNTQSRFEKDENLPGGEYLLALDALGIDAGYVLTGKPSLSDPAELALITGFRRADEIGQQMALRAVNVQSVGQGAAVPGIAIHGGNQAQVIQGGVKLKNARISVYGDKKKD